ncbi:MAG: lipid-A-disaccharide synthase [Bacteroidota bacterium]
MKLYLISGEDSGDMHGANLVKALKNKVPDLQLRGIGGERLIEQGLIHLAHVRDINYMGFVEIVQHLRVFRRLFRTIKQDIQTWRPDAVVLIDYPGFNLRMAPFIKSLGIPVIFYISPQVWAWKKGRVKKIKRCVDRMLVILPFEVDFYQQEGMEVDFVGHPLLDELKPVDHRPTQPPTIALLPGSRKQEILRVLPSLLALPDRFPDHRFVIGGAPSQTEEFYRALIPADKRVELVMDQTHALLQQADYAVVSSGTATLETALFEVPEVVVYRGSAISFWLAKRLVKVPFISLVNLIMGESLVEELLQGECNPNRISQALKRLMQPTKNAQIKAGYQLLREKLGREGASEKAAEIVASFDDASFDN